jgi:DNA replication protein DnaC
MSLRIKGVIECEFCRDTGYRTLGGDSDRRVVRCECQIRGRADRLLAEANIPNRYHRATLATFDLAGPRESLSLAHLWALHFVESYPVDGERGTLFIGNCGTGKTHLAIGIVKALIAKGIAGRFCDYCSLLQEIRSTYDPDSAGSELQTLRPLFDVPVLILDDLGAMRPSPWALDTITFLLNTRYGRGLTTIVTTNYADALRSERSYEPTLQERVSERVVSRLREMCRFVEMYGEDFRCQIAPPNLMKFRARSAEF